MSMGVTVAMLSLIILIPLASVLAYSFRLSAGEFAELMTRPNVVQSFVTSIGCALFAAVINCVFGVILAWVLVRYEFPGKRLMDGMIELPFALPTAVAGITLTKMYSDSGVLGRAFESIGIEIAYTKTGIVIAMIFIGIPFVVRAIQPVLETLSPSYEEAAYMLGASRLTAFWKIIFPEIRPALLTGFGLALARGIGEYGSVIYISGNSEKNGTQVVSYIIMQKLNSGNVDYEGAAAIALVLLVISFIMLFLINIIQHVASRRTNA
ncbi:MAG: sulfate ABC transporter permease subunit CysT [Eubacterium sp.]|nr:sulfate ABC transporter permease subunit CysT [Eubacterium sp.]